MQDQEAQDDPDDRDHVGDERGPGGAPAGQQPEVREVGEPRAEQAEPGDREDGLGVRPGVPGVLEDDGDGSRDQHREGDLEDGRDHRRDATHVVPRVDGSGGVAQRRPEQGDLAGDVGPGGPEVAAGQDDDADEADREAGHAVDPDGLVVEEERGDDDREERNRGREDGRDRGVDRSLRPGDQGERDDDVDAGHHDQVAVQAPLSRKLLSGQPQDHPQEDGPDRQPKRHQRERPEVVDRELDEEVARAPHEAERQEDQPQGAIRGFRHRRMIPTVGLRP